MSIVLQTRKKPKRTSSDNVVIKSEQLDFEQETPIFPEFFPSDNETEMADDVINTTDATSLKGQVWPGMGKMDLASEEMKRTRNQRKPKSVVEKMRRTSEGIEPTQVVMTPEFTIERVKGVYDDDSPVSDEEEPVSSITSSPPHSDNLFIDCHADSSPTPQAHPYSTQEARSSNRNSS